MAEHTDTGPEDPDEDPNEDPDFDSHLCVICNGPFSDKNQPVSPEIEKLRTLFDACVARQDPVGKKLLKYKDEILNEHIYIQYHRDCRSTYTSAYHIQKAIKRKEAKDAQLQCSDSSASMDIDSPFTRSRSMTPTFNWKLNCFVCGGPCYPQKRTEWSVVATAIDTDKPSMYKTILDAANQKQDIEMITRLKGVPNGDLVAVEARYHRKKGCVAKYTDSRKIAGTVKQTQLRDFYTAAGRRLIDEFNAPLFSDRQVVHLTTLKKRFCELATIEGVENPDSYKSYNLKRLLKSICPVLSFIPQPGMSDLVCSSDITVGDALRLANDLDQSLQDVCDETFLQDSEVSESEDRTVHKACGILRQRIATTQKLDNEYYSSNEMTLQAQKEFVDPLLYKTIGWLTDETLFLEGDDISNKSLNAKCLTIACDITTLVTSVMSPKHIGLSVHLHHDYGSRKLIEDMYALGYGISYTELRQFLTSAAVHVSTAQPGTPSGGVVPPEIVPRQSGGKLIVAAGDNWDHNERTVDGKRTTHAMTTILASPKSEDELSFPRISRSTERSLDISDLPGGNLASILPYKKPQRRPEPVFYKSPRLEFTRNIPEEVVKLSKLKELLYNICRCDVFCEDVAEAKCVPPWSTFQACLESKQQAVTNVAFNPIIMAPPSDYSTIYTTLKRTKECVNSLGQIDVPIYFDMGLLTKALEITWARPDEMHGIIPCEGGMHLLMCVFAAIGYLYGDAGLRELLFDSDVFALGSAQQILAGKDFDRALRAFKLVDEALNNRFLFQFKRWCDKNGKAIPDILSQDIVRVAERFSRSTASERPENILAEINEEAFQDFQEVLQEFRQEGRSMSPTFQFWDDFLTRVTLPLKLFISSTRLGLWDLNQYAKREFLPLLFATNRSIYSKYMSYLILQMKQLPNDVNQGFQDGLFVSKLKAGNFNSVWIDYVLEATENKALKGTGGIIGLTLRGNSLARWFLARPVTAKYSMTFHANVCKGEAESEKGKSTHHSDTEASKKRFDKDVEKMTQLFEGTFIDPFDTDNPSDHLVNFASGVVTTPAVEESLLKALDRGSEMAIDFMKQRLIPSEDDKPVKSFYDPLPKSGVKTMADMQKTVHVQSSSVTINGEVMYLRLLAMNSFKKVPLERVLSFENAPVPLSMFNDDGSMISCTKSDFMHKLESLHENKIVSVQSADCIIFDAMAIIQMLPMPTRTLKVTFIDMAKQFMQYVLHSSRAIHSVAQIHIVFDRYAENSLKLQTRQKRGDTGTSHKIHIQAEIPIPKEWKKFLARGENKENLAAYYTNYVMENASEELNEEETVYLSGGLKDKAYKVTKDDTSQYLPLQSNQEEADTRMILHAVISSRNDANTIIVCSPDTDVLVLLLHHRPAIRAREIFFLTGRTGTHVDMKRFIPVHELFCKLTKEQQSILISAYCLTGCDTCNAFFGIGKKSVYKVVMQNADNFQMLSELGSGPPSKAQRLACTQFVGLLYGKKDCRSLNEIRCEKAMRKVPPKKLPPTDNSFTLHVMRCCYQLLIWKTCGTAFQELPPPTDFGFESYEVTEGKTALRPKMMSQSPAAPELLNDLVCECPNRLCDEACSCFCNEQPCTTACVCRAAVPWDEQSEDDICTNVYTILSFQTATESDNDSE